MFVLILSPANVFTISRSISFRRAKQSMFSAQKIDPPQEIRLFPAGEYFVTICTKNKQYLIAIAKANIVAYFKYHSTQLINESQKRDVQKYGSEIITIASSAMKKICRMYGNALSTMLSHIRFK
jgi:hypothetical protein